MPLDITGPKNPDLAANGHDENYQMVPHGGTRDLVVQTGDTKAELNLTGPDISSLSDFRILKQAQPSLGPLPGPGVQVRRVVLPERCTVQFTLHGRAAGMTILEGRDRVGFAGATQPPSLRVLVSVKLPQMRKYGVCYVFDRVKKDTGARVDFPAAFRRVNNTFLTQTNFTVVNIDDDIASKQSARTVTLNGSLGPKFNAADLTMVGRMVAAIERKFIGLFDRTHALVIQLPVPMHAFNPKSSKFEGLSALNYRVRRTSDGREFNLVVLAPDADPFDLNVPYTLTHEIGHSLGLAHQQALPTPDLLLRLPGPLVTFDHNLMFPGPEIMSFRLTRLQIEVIHTTRVEPTFVIP
jgi:hypothetical protein